MRGGLISEGTRTAGGPLAAMVAQGRAANARDLGLRRGPRAARGALVGAQAGERRARELRVALRHFAHQFEEQRQRARRSSGRAFMLRRTMLR